MINLIQSFQCQRYITNSQVTPIGTVAILVCVKIISACVSLLSLVFDPSVNQCTNCLYSCKRHLFNFIFVLIPGCLAFGFTLTVTIYIKIKVCNHILMLYCITRSYIKVMTLGNQVIPMVIIPSPMYPVESLGSALDNHEMLGNNFYIISKY